MEGKDVLLEQRYAEGRLDRLPALAVELVHLKVDVIVTGSSAGTRPAKESTATIPILMAQDTDPVGNGYVASLARPGGNITGLSTLSPELSGKRLEVLKEIVPKLSSVVVFGTSTQPGSTQALRETELAARAFGLRLQYLDVLSPKDVEPSFRTAGNTHAGVALVLQSAVFNAQRKQIVDLAIQSRIPMMYYSVDWVEDGGLMSYGVNFPDMYRRAATYVDKIQKGAKPSDLPVEQPRKFELVINLKAAKQIGVTIPPNVLGRADKVIK